MNNTPVVSKAIYPMYEMIYIINSINNNYYHMCFNCMYYICFNVNVKSLGYKQIGFRKIKFLIGRMPCRLGGGSAFCFLTLKFILLNFNYVYVKVSLHEVYWSNSLMSITVSCRPGGGTASRLILQHYITKNTIISYIGFLKICIYNVGRAAIHISLLIKFILSFSDKLIQI